MMWGFVAFLGWCACAGLAWAFLAGAKKLEQVGAAPSEVSHLKD